ncbi:hypothetical protein MRX96_029562 [Rhipicephalus microplus]
MIQLVATGCEVSPRLQSRPKEERTRMCGAHLKKTRERLDTWQRHPEDPSFEDEAERSDALIDVVAWLPRRVRSTTEAHGSADFDAAIRQIGAASPKKSELGHELYMEVNLIHIQSWGSGDVGWRRTSGLSASRTSHTSVHIPSSICCTDTIHVVGFTDDPR